MTVREIVTIPDPHLRKICDHVDVIDDEIRTLLDDMLETMYGADGIGLAASQIGVMKRVIVIHIRPRQEEAEAQAEEKETIYSDPLFIINPEIIWRSDAQRSEQEGCLSIPDIQEEVSRPDRVRFSFLDRNGKPCEMESSGILATCIQHEIDHLNGVLFIDYLSRLKRDRIWSRARKEHRRSSRESA